jgi:membrane-associated protein
MLDTLNEIFWYLVKFTDHLREVIDKVGPYWTYGILFAIVFCETGLVITPFLPGDSLLFTVGVLAAALDNLNVHIAAGVLVTAAIIGDTVNYHVGKFLGPKVLKREDSWIFKKKYLDMTHAYFEKYGARTIIIARWVPIVRTFAPFVAGVGSMKYREFLMYNVVGAFIWVYGLVYAGYMFANVWFVKDHLSKVILAIVIISVLPMVWEVFRVWRDRNEPGPAASQVAGEAVEPTTGNDADKPKP